MDPYEVLGIPRDSSFQEVRARYIYLAKKHHPDKLINLSEEERKTNEEYFQKVSVAYSQIENGKTTQTSNDGTTPPDPEHWRNIWAKVETMFQRPDVWECMRQAFADTLSDVATKVREHKNKHTIRVPVSLEELHVQKQKKIQIFLQNVNDPIRVVLDCGSYPHSYTFMRKLDGEDHIIELQFDVKSHDKFHVDTILDTLDLYTELDISWCEYITGMDRKLCLLDGETITVSTKPFEDVIVPKTFEGKGLAGKGDLIVSLKLAPPTYENWCGLGPTKQQEFVEILNALTHMSSGVEEPKTI